jgi:pilus assembly protein CpaC
MLTSLLRPIAAQLGASIQGGCKRLPALAGCLGIAACIAIASNPRFAAAQQLKVEAPQAVVHKVQGANESMELIVNTSRILTLDQKIPRAQVNNPDILELTPLSATQIQIMAKKPGVTQVNLWDENDNVHSVDVIVFADSQELTMLLKQLFPKAALKVTPLPNSVMISGWVDDPNMVRKIIAISEEYHPKVLNNITVGGVQQVLLQIKVYEVSRTKLRQLGFDWGNLTSRGDLAVQGVGGLIKASAAAGTPPQGFTAGTGMAAAGAQTFTYGVVSPGNSFFGVLDVLQARSVAKVLAEPQLTTVSGRPAFFNVGGEFPILVPQSLGTLSIQYKKFGTQVDFVPIVLGNGAIRLEVRPRVSEIDESRSVSINGTTVPGLRTREIDTGAEMQAGQTLAIAGLVQMRIEDDTRGVPWLSDLPFFGVPFRKMTEAINEIELLILVTPQLVEAMDPCDVPTSLPGMASSVPSDWQFYSRGHVEVPNCDPTGQLLGPYPNGPFNGGYHPVGGPMPSGAVPGGAMQGQMMPVDPDGTVVPGSVRMQERLPPGTQEAPLPPARSQPPAAPRAAAPKADGQSHRRTIRLPEISPSSRRQPAAFMPGRNASPAAAGRSSLQKASIRTMPAAPAAPKRQKTAPGFIGPTGYDLR